MSSGAILTQNMQWSGEEDGIYLVLPEGKYKVTNLNVIANGSMDLCITKSEDGAIGIAKIEDTPPEKIIHIPQYDIAHFEFDKELPLPYQGRYLILEIDEQFVPLIQYTIQRFPSEKPEDYDKYIGREYTRPRFVWDDIWQELGQYYQCYRCSPNTCCTYIPVQVSQDECHKIANYLGIDVREFVQGYTHFGEGKQYLKFPCPFYEDGCKVYEVRPELCRRYPFGDLPGVIHVNVCPMARDIAKDLGLSIPPMKLDLMEVPERRDMPEGTISFKTDNVIVPFPVMYKLLERKRKNSISEI